MSQAEQFPALESFEGGPEGLRDAYDRARKALKERDTEIGGLQAELREGRIAKAGFGEGSPGHKLIKDHFTGDLSDAEAVKAFAAEYGMEPKEIEPLTPAPDDTQAGDQGLEALQQAGVQAPPGNQVEQLKQEISKAESEGRLRDAISLKNRLQALTVPRP
jgi:hypothetical protein